MKVEEIIPLPEDRVRFDIAHFKTVPKEAGCYLLTTFEGNILYIGLAKNLFKRFQNHLANPDKTKPTKEGKAFWFYFKIYDPKNLPKLERTWLNHFESIHGILPIRNKIKSPVQ